MMASMPIKRLYPKTNFSTFTVEDFLNIPEDHQRTVISDAIWDNQLDFLNKLESLDLLPKQWSENRIFCFNIDTVAWLLNHGWIGDKTGAANSAAQSAQMDKLIWLESQGILPDSEAFNSVYIGPEDFEVLFNWLTQRGIRPTVLQANAAYRADRQDMVNAFASVGVHPNLSIPAVVMPAG